MSSYVLSTLSILSLSLPLDIFMRFALPGYLSVFLLGSELELLTLPATLVALLLFSLLPCEFCLIVMNYLPQLFNFLPQSFLHSISLMIRLLPQICPDITSLAKGGSCSVRISLKLGDEISCLCQLRFQLLGYSIQFCYFLVLLVDILIVFVD